MSVSAEPRRILAVNLNYLGDALFTTPALAALCARFPNAEIDVLAGERASATLKGNPAISRLILRPPHGGSGRATVLRQTLHAGDYDTVILFQSTLSNALLTFLERVPCRVGFAQDGCGPFLTHSVAERAPGEHIVDAYLRLAEALTGPEATSDAAADGLRITIPPEDDQFAKEFLQDANPNDAPIVGLAIGATRPQKRWFEEHFARLADLLHYRLGARVLLLGGASEVEAAEHIQQMCHAPLLSAVGKTTEKQLAAVSARLTAIVSGDSGPLHVATAVRTPVVALFGSTDPADTGPWQPKQGVVIPATTFYDRIGCAPCRKNPTCGGTFDCLWTLTPDRVFDAVCNLIGIEPKPMKQFKLPMLGAWEEEKPLRVRRSTVPAPRSVMVITKHHFMGDAVVTVPLLRATRQAFGDNMRLTVLTGAAAATVLDGCPYVDSIIPYNPKRDRGYLKQIQFLKECQHTPPDICLVVDRSFRTAVLAATTGSEVRSGFAAEHRAFLLTHPVPYRLDRREIECCLDILRAIVPDGPGPDRYDATPQLWITSAERERGWEILAAGGAGRFSKLIGIQPGASYESKQWNTERFAAVADALAAREDAGIVLLGGKNEIETAQKMMELVSPKTPTFNLVGITSLRETMAVLAHMCLFVSNDSGVAHIAAGMHTPLVTLFGSTSSLKWGNYGPYNVVVRAPNNELKHLSVEQVVEAAKHVLQKTSLDGVQRQHEVAAA